MVRRVRDADGNTWKQEDESGWWHREQGSPLPSLEWVNRLFGPVRKVGEW